MKRRFSADAARTRPSVHACTRDGRRHFSESCRVCRQTRTSRRFSLAHAPSLCDSVAMVRARARSRTRSGAERGRTAGHRDGAAHGDEHGVQEPERAFARGVAKPLSRVTRARAAQAALVKNLVRASVSEVCYLRGLFPGESGPQRPRRARSPGLTRVHRHVLYGQEVRGRADQGAEPAGPRRRRQRRGSRPAGVQGRARRLGGPPAANLTHASLQLTRWIEEGVFGACAGPASGPAPRLTAAALQTRCSGGT